MQYFKVKNMFVAELLFNSNFRLVRFLNLIVSSCYCNSLIKKNSYSKVVDLTKAIRFMV